jgi:hypothetical protein
MSAFSVPAEDIISVSETTEELFKDAIFYDDACMETMLVFHEVLVSPQNRRQGLGRRTYILSSYVY